MTSTNKTLNEFFSDFADKVFPLKCSKCGLEYEDTGRNLINLKERLERKPLTEMQIIELVNWLELTLKDEGVIYCYCPKCREDKEFEKFNESIPDRYRNLHTDRKQELQQYYDDNLYIYGEGEDKTIFAVDVARKNYVKYNIPLLFVGYPRFAMQLTSSFRTKENPYTFADKIADFRGMVIINDISVNMKLSEFIKQITYRIIDERCQYSRRTIITADKDLVKVCKQIDERLVTKISEMAKVIEITSKENKNEYGVS